MRWVAMASALLAAHLAAAAEPPVTQAEALAFHAGGRCSMMEPGHGLSRPDGRGWIVSSLPGEHVIRNGSTSTLLDMTPGRAYPIKAPGGVVEWCPRFVPPGRTACGPVPPAFLYDAVTVQPWSSAR